MPQKWVAAVGHPDHGGRPRRSRRRDLAKPIARLAYVRPAATMTPLAQATRSSACVIYVTPGAGS